MRGLLLISILAISLKSVSHGAVDLTFRRNGGTISIESSSDLQNWQTLTNFTLADPQKFFRTSRTDSIPLTFLYEPRVTRPVSFFNRYYGVQGYSEPLTDAYPNQDSQGIRMFKASDGKLYDHQTLQSEYALAMINAYYNTSNSAYLDRAEKYAQHLIATKIESRRAWFWPCKYPFQLRWWPDSEIINPPFYGALGQGTTLSMFVVLYQQTKNPSYLNAARKTFAAFLAPPQAGQPYITEVDEEDYLWFEEYAFDPARPQHVLNGHIFALLGVYDYCQLTGDADAARLLEGALFTVKRWFPWFRTPGWIVKYSRAVPVFNRNYQEPVIRLLRVCYSISGDTFFAHAAEQLADDYPSFQYAAPGTVLGGLTGYQFDQEGTITNSLASIAAKPGKVWVGLRQSILNQPGTWLYVKTGTLSNYWVREFPPQAVMNCIVQPIPFDPPRRATLKGPAPAYTFTKFETYGGVIDAKSRAFSSDQSMVFDRRAWINSRLYIRIAGGEFDQYWTPVTIRTLLD